jgi:hypothetical protein
MTCLSWITQKPIEVARLAVGGMLAGQGEVVPVRGVLVCLESECYCDVSYLFQGFANKVITVLFAILPEFVVLEVTKIMWAPLSDPKMTAH